MKGIPELRFKNLLPHSLRYEFIVQMDRKGIDRVQIISWLGVVLYSCLFLLDYLRMQQDSFNRILFYFHIGGALYLFPALLATFAKEKMKATRISRGVVIWFTFLLTTVVLFGQAFESFQEYHSLTMYMTYVIVANWTFAMNHSQRILFNLACMSLMTMGIITLGDTEDNVRFLIKIYEVFFFTLIAFIFGTFDYNLRADKFLEEKELVREKARIEELEMLKSRMYTNLTHEFRTPLTVIAGMASQIQVNPTKWGEKGSEMIRRNSTRILNLVNQILDLSKLESGSMSLKLVNGDVITNLRYIIDSFQSYAESKNIRLHFLTDLNELYLDYDPEKSLTVISNLLSNALKYTPDGGNVYLRANKIESSEGPRFELRIRDTGVGIPEEKLDLIFERFYQIEDQGVKGSTGTGIGLAIVKELVKLMEGNIKVTSKIGIGSEFILDFPITNDVEVASAQFVP
ncbi:MAG TPA: HAMP domain-containing sensor histidine kinase, partial [Saprospiraceae bacterium]|nr:HAMP domain-containing sensor histidine kinase [Saprospiraceae bacterium]